MFLTIVFQTSTYLRNYSKDLQEKKSHTENRKAPEIVLAILQGMKTQMPQDIGAPYEYWFPGELSNSYRPFVENLSPKSYFEAMFPERLFSVPQKSRDALNAIDERKYGNLVGGLDENLWRRELFEKQRTLVGYLFKEDNAGYNSRGICTYRRSLLEAFLEEDSKIMDALLFAFSKQQKKTYQVDKISARDIMWSAFHKRSKNKHFLLGEEATIGHQPATLIAYILLVSDFVFSSGTMNTLYDILVRNCLPHRSFAEQFKSEGTDVLEGLSKDYTPLADYPNPDWLNQDRIFIQEVFLKPQSVLTRKLVGLITHRNSLFKPYMYQDRATSMISAEWLNIVNILGYTAQSTTYLRKCFPGLLKALSNYPTNKSKTPKVAKNASCELRYSNLVPFAHALGEFVFGDNSFFVLKDDDLKLWDKYGFPPSQKNSTENLRVQENWVANPWLHFRLRSKPSEDHPFYDFFHSFMPRVVTITNIVEWLFFGKMWDKPSNYGKDAMYDDEKEKLWEKTDYRLDDDLFIDPNYKPFVPIAPPDENEGSEEESDQELKRKSKSKRGSGL
jgi:hypothetical protein